MRDISLEHLSEVLRFRKRQSASRASMNRRPFDMSKTDFETIRHRKRRKLLLWSIPGVVILLLIALWFLLPSPLTSHAIADYKNQNYRRARDWLTPLTWTSPQPFVIAFNSGTVDTQLGHYPLAQTELTRALTLAPANKRCMVLQNLAISITDHVAVLQQQGNYQNASSLNTQVSSIRSDNPKCFPPIQPTKTPPSGGGGGGGGGGESESETQTLTPAEAQQLQQKNQQGEQSEQQEFAPNNINPNNPNVKPW
jgi:hypothetical protein